MPKKTRVLLSALIVLTLGVLHTQRAYAHGLLVASDPTGRRAAGPSPEEPAIALTLHRVTAAIDGPVASVQVEQVFRNRTAQRLEGTWLFPLPAGAAVSKFAMTMGGRLVEGEVMDADRARAIYESIVRRRRDPGLLEYVGRGLYRARVFPIEPRGDVTIRLAFQQILPEDRGTFEFRYPLATDRLHGQPVDEVVVTVDVRSDVPVRAIYSPSHDVAVVRKGEREAQASCEGSGRRQRRDFVLYVGRSPEDVGISVLSHRRLAEDGTFLAVLAPTTKPSETVVPKDVIFVLDTSGSMKEDGKIHQALRALEFGIGVLRSDDRFGIVTFANTTRRFRRRLLPADPASRKAAKAWLAGIGAEGGTNLHQGLLDGIALAEDGRLPVLVLLSDGRPTAGVRDTEAIVADVRAHNAASARVFTFGVGHDVDVQLLDLIAEDSRGARDYVAPREELEIVTSRFFRKVVDPVLTDVTLDLGDDVYDVYPSELPDLFSAARLS